MATTVAPDLHVPAPALTIDEIDTLTAAGPGALLVVIGPALAKTLLKRNRKNRNLREATVLERDGHLPPSALGALRAEVRAARRFPTPLRRRRTQHGRILSLDADLGGVSLYDLVAADVDLLVHTTGGVYEDKRLNVVLGGLDPVERQIVFVYAEGEGTTWTEAAATVGATDPQAFGKRVRRKAKRLATGQNRRLTRRRATSPR
ncbi:hypothetical protein ACR6C2_05405 [Streptomyces sp. INA 01156]